MKYIQKVGSPAAYTQWRLQMRGQDNENYKELKNPPKDDLHSQLIAEQGFLCGYTMRRISVDSSHIEHIKPEHVCRDEDKQNNTTGSDLDYDNIIACYPKDGMPGQYRYGAQKKDRWWDNNGIQFISPLDPQCEHFFIFNMKGEIIARNKNAAKTIEVLALNHQSLMDDRKQAIEEYIYGRNKASSLSIKQANTALVEIAQRKPKGEFYEYCIAIKHALNEHIAYLTKVAQKRKHAQSQKKKA